MDKPEQEIYRVRFIGEGPKLEERFTRAVTRLQVEESKIPIVFNEEIDGIAITVSFAPAPEQGEASQ